MKPLYEISPRELDNIKVVTFDVDGVIIPTGSQVKENETGTEFYMKTHKLSPRFNDLIQELKKYVRVNFSSGRSFLYLRSLVNAIFDNSVILQAENGSITWIDGKITHPAFNDSIYTKLRDLQEEIRRLKISGAPIRAFEPKMFILTVHSDEVKEIPELVCAIDPEGELSCVRGGEAYDIGGAGVHKGRGIEELAKYLNISEKQIMTTGNHRNDAEMLQRGLGVTVTPDLVPGDYFIAPQEGVLGGEVLAEFLIQYYSKRKA